MKFGLVIRASQMEVSYGAAAGILTGDLDALRLGVLISSLTSEGLTHSAPAQGWPNAQRASQLRDSGRLTLLFPPFRSTAAPR